MTKVSLPAKPEQITEIVRALRGPANNAAAVKLDDRLSEIGFPRPSAKRYDRRGHPVHDLRARRDAVLQALVG